MEQFLRPSADFHGLGAVSIQETSLEIIPLRSDSQKSWDDFARHSEDAWFWHTTAWMVYAEEYARDRFVKNRSFFVIENSESLAICPVVVERSLSFEGALQLSLAGGPLPFPAMRNGLTDDKRDKVLDCYVDALAALAKEECASYVSVRLPSVTRFYNPRKPLFANPLLRHGYIDLAYLTQVIDLGKSEKELWADIRKGHKSDIKRAGEMCETKVLDQHTITPDKFKEYQALHRKDAGRITRSQRTFDLMLSWVKEGHAILVEANYGGRAIGFSLVMCFASGAYYGSSCKDPDCPAVPASHLIQWETIVWLKAHGFEWYDIGIQQFRPQWFDPAGSKDISISKFKRGFGGRTCPLLTTEWFFSNELLERTMEARWRTYLSSLFHQME